ncbi:MAG: DUF3310 domain-containing protein [Armatimonadota bacterium]|nr:DUF3310 domain-containing protein [Armatimonadota bacterium]
MKSKLSDNKENRKSAVDTDSQLAKQVGGDHYKTMTIQPVEFIHVNKLDYLSGNVIKYIVRHRAKGNVQDVKKAIHYCQLILELEYGEKE